MSIINLSLLSKEFNKLNNMLRSRSFVRGGPTLTGFFCVFFWGGGGGGGGVANKGWKEDPISINAGHYPSTSKTPFKWSFAGGQTMAKH